MLALRKLQEPWRDRQQRRSLGQSSTASMESSNAEVSFAREARLAYEFSLGNFLWKQAIFYAERLVAESPCDESSYMLALAYFHNKEASRASWHLRGNRLPEARYLLARCCFSLCRWDEAEQALLPGTSSDLTEVAHGAAGIFLLGQVRERQGRREQALECYTRCLEVCPFMWDAYERWSWLALWPSKSSTAGMLPSTFSEERLGQALASLAAGVSGCSSRASAGSGASQRCGVAPGVRSRSAAGLERHGGNSAAAHAATGSTTPAAAGIAAAAAGVAACGSAGCGSAGLAAAGAGGATSPTAMASPPGMAAGGAAGQCGSFASWLRPVQTPAPGAKSQSGPRSDREPPRKERRGEVRPCVHGAASQGTGSSGGSVGGPAREPRDPQRRLLSGDAAALGGGGGNTMGGSEDTQVSLASLLYRLGAALHAMHNFENSKTIQLLNTLPKRHHRTGYVLDLVGLCHFESADYKRAEEVYKQVWRLEPQRVEGLEYYSSALWHLRKDIELGHLAQQCLQWDRLKPQVWCVVGNSFSLQKEHDVAIKFFKRAIQVDPCFTYAYTLCGHEFVANEKFDKAMPMYEQALAVDPRHYNAWWGLGNIYHRQEEHENARFHFLRALEINKTNSVLRCYLGMVLDSMNNPQSALDNFELATKGEPLNGMVFFQKACVLMSLDRFEDALVDLKKVHSLAPKEACVHFQLGKAYMRLQRDRKALHHFNSAMDLNRDSKDYHTIKTHIEQLHVRGVSEDRLDGQNNKPHRSGRLRRMFVSDSPADGRDDQGFLREVFAGEPPPLPRPNVSSPGARSSGDMLSGSAGGAPQTPSDPLGSRDATGAPPQLHPGRGHGHSGHGHGHAPTWGSPMLGGSAVAGAPPHPGGGGVGSPATRASSEQGGGGGGGPHTPAATRGGMATSAGRHPWSGRAGPPMHGGRGSAGGAGHSSPPHTPGGPFHSPIAGFRF